MSEGSVQPQDLTQALACLAGFDWTNGDLAQRSAAAEAVLASDIQTITLRLRTGASMIVNCHDYLPVLLVRDGQYEPALTKFIQTRLRPGDTFIDVGAHIGLHTITAARTVGASGHVYAFEPEPQNFLDLRQNLSLNGLKNATSLRCGVGDRRRTLKLAPRPGNTGGGALGVSLDWRRPTIDVAPLDWLLPHCRPRLIKIDVEGFELKVLNGALQTLARARPICVFEYNAETLGAEVKHRRALYRFFADMGWPMFIVSIDANSDLTFNRLSDPYIAPHFMDVYAMPPELEAEVTAGCSVFPYDHEGMRRQYPPRPRSVPPRPKPQRVRSVPPKPIA